MRWNWRGLRAAGEGVEERAGWAAAWIGGQARSGQGWRVFSFLIGREDGPVRSASECTAMCRVRRQPRGGVIGCTATVACRPGPSFRVIPPVEVPFLAVSDGANAWSELAPSCVPGAPLVSAPPDAIARRRFPSVASLSSGLASSSVPPPGAGVGWSNFSRDYATFLALWRRLHSEAGCNSSAL